MALIHAGRILRADIALDICNEQCSVLWTVTQQNRWWSHCNLTT